MAYWDSSYLNPYGAKPKPKVDFFAPPSNPAPQTQFGQIPGVNAPSAIQNIVSQAQKSPQLQQSFQQAFAPQPKQTQVQQPTEMQQPSTGKLSVDDFAQKIKTKYPEYDKVDNTELTQKMIEKYPEYRDKIELPVVWWGTKWIAADLWQKITDLGKWELINPIWAVTTRLSRQAQKIPTLTKKDYEDFANKNLGGFTADTSVIPTMVINAIPSAIKTITGIWSAITNPLDTAAWLYSLIFTKEWHQAVKDRFGGWEQLGKTMTEDPVWLASDALALLEWGANLASKWAKLWGLSETSAKLSDVAKTAWAASNLWVDALVPTIESLWAKGGKVGNIATKALIAPVQPLKTIKDLWVIDKLTPWINIKGQDIKDAQKNPYIVDQLNNIHETTNWDMSNVDATSYKNEQVKKVWDEHILPALDNLEKTYSEWGQLYQDIRATNQQIDVSWLQEEAQAVVDKYPQSSLTATDKTNIKNAMTKVEDILRDAKDGKFDVNAGLDTRQSFDAGIDYNMSSAKGNQIVKEIRTLLDKRLKEQVAWLRETDALASKKIKQLKEFKKQLITKEWTINYTNLKNSNSLAKTDLGNRLDEFVPGATDRIDAIDKAIKIAKKTKWVWFLWRLTTKWTAALLWAAFWGPLWAAIGFILEPSLEGVVNKNLSSIKQNKILDVFKEMSPEATTRLEEIWNKIKSNENLSKADKDLITKARQKYNVDKVKNIILDTMK